MLTNIKDTWSNRESLLQAVQSFQSIMYVEDAASTTGGSDLSFDA